MTRSDRTLGNALCLPLALGMHMSATGCRRDADSAARPNIVLIIIDTLRADKLGSYGYPRETSPEIDALASRGVLFETTIAQSSGTNM